jgi:hypothetical protein
VAETPARCHTSLGDAITALDNLTDFARATIDAPERVALRAASPKNKQGD